MLDESPHIPRPSPDVSPAIKEFLDLLDEGLTQEKVVELLKRCETRGPDYLNAVKVRLKLFARSIDVINQIE